MLKNKIYKYITIEIFKTFFTILFAFTAIAWTVRAVNFLDLVVDNGHSINTYLLFSLLNITNIITKFIPLTFLLSLIIVIQKLERQNELLILWTTGLNKIKLVNLFFKISLIVFLMQLVFAVFITPNSLNKSRSLIKTSDFASVSSIIKINKFSDSFEDVTFFVEKKNDKGQLINIFIRDESNTFKSLVSDSSNSSNTTIIAKSGLSSDDRLVLFDGIIQTENKDGIINNVEFKKTQLLIDPLLPRTITQPKLQETFTYMLIQCVMNNNNIYSVENINCPESNLKKEVIETLSRRFGMPIYIPVISLICSFLLIFSKGKKIKFYKKYIYFTIGFFLLVVAEILVRYAGFTSLNTFLYFLLPLLLAPLIYLILINKLNIEKIR